MPRTNPSSETDLDQVTNLLSVTQQGSETVAEIYLYDRIATRFWGGFSPDLFRDLVAEAGTVDRYVIRILSEGGSTIGGNAIASEIQRLTKPVRAEVEVAMSAATIVALACDEIVIAENGWWMVHHAAVESYDPLKAAELRSLADRLDTINDQLTARYIAATGMEAEALAELMNSERWLSGAEAVEAGFCARTMPAVTTLGDFEPLNLSAESQREALRSLSAAFRHPSTGDESVTKETNTTPAPQVATLAEIKASAPGCTNDFAVDQLERNATVDAVRAAYQTQQADTIKALKTANEAFAEKVTALEEELEAAKARKAEVDGTDAVNADATGDDTDIDSSDPVAAWNGLLAVKTAKGLSRQKAVAACVREFPQAHKALLAASRKS
jgi:ATP-dependent protease ClpP protease subunit